VPAGVDVETAATAPRRRFFPERRAAWADTACIALLVLFALVFFEPLLTGHTFSTVPGFQNSIYPWAATPTAVKDSVQDDQAALSYGWNEFDSRALSNGTVPFWDPSSFGGYPHLANGSTGVFNPVRLATEFVRDPGWSHDLFSIIVVIGGGLFGFLLARDLSLRRPGAILAAVAWMLSAWNLGWLHLEVVSPIILFFPAGMWAVGRAVQRRSATWVAVGAATIALTLVSVHLLFGLIDVYICLLYGLVLVAAPALRRSGRDWHAVRGRAVRFGGASVGALLLAAPIILPTFLALQDSQRVPLTYQQLTKTLTASPSWFLTTFVPANTPITAHMLNSHMAWAGTATAILALVGLFWWRRTAVIVGGVLLAGLFLVAVGTPLTWLVFRLAPGMNVFRPYSRLEMWWALGLGLMAGAGLDLVVEKVSKWRVPAAGRIATALACVVIVGTAGQLLAYGRDTNPPFPKRSAAGFFPSTPLLRAMRTDRNDPSGWPKRNVGVKWFATYKQVLWATTPLAVDLDSLTGYDSTIPVRTTNLVRAVAGVNLQTVLATGLTGAYRPTVDVTQGARVGLLSRLGVSQVVLPPGSSLGMWFDPIRRAGGHVTYSGPDGILVDLAPSGPRLVGGTERVANATAAFDAFVTPSFDNAQRVILEPDQIRRLGTSALPVSAGSAGVVTHATRGINSGRLEVDARRSSWLLIPESWDPGWTATVNGYTVPMLRANYQQRAILVPAGRSIVTISYVPPGWNLGLVLGAFGVVSLLAAGVAMEVLRRRRRAAPSSTP
jgi:hypothetical protein